MTDSARCFPSSASPGRRLFPARKHPLSDYLDSFLNLEKDLSSVRPRDFRLSRIRKVLSVLGNPERHLKILHIAGTKGKGSTAAFTAEILRAAGYKVGLYTSPHLCHVRERIRLLSPSARSRRGQREFKDCISKKAMAVVLADLSPVLEAFRDTKKYGRLTYFEVLTILALSYFYKQQVDFVVFETGLGGRLDATNAVPSLIAGITPISLDHTAILGNTLEAIAGEKAAIIKSRGQRVVIARQPPEALKVIKKRCQQFSVKPLFVGQDITFERKDFNWQRQRALIRTPKAEYELSLRLHGLHQVENAATAVGFMTALQAEGYAVPAAAIRQGARTVFWPGRFEIIRRRPFIIIDGAHNPYSLTRLAETVRELFCRGTVYLILGVSADKDWLGICRAIFPVAREVILTKAHHPRALTWDPPAVSAVSTGQNIYYASHIKAAFRQVLKKVRPQDLILVTGSIFLVSEARALLSRKT